MNQVSLKQNYTIKEIVHDFQIKSITALPTIQSVLYELEYLKNGARMIHIANDTSNNCFAIGFRTTPKSNTGIAHILEHFVLCGSKNYPLRDPFFSMIKRSLKTFMNAFTASDWTMYPFSTQNKTDYFNLMSVYLDAALFPLLTEQSFMQEGCRIELEDNDDIQSDIMFKGVVFNEMKGAMSTQSSIMQRGMMRALFPTSTYGYNSGGDPIDIPNLTLEQLREFHQNYYHPSNSWIYTYGNIPLEENLAFIGDRLKEFPTKNTTNTEVAVETRSKEPYLYTSSYPIQENELNGRNHQIALGWIFCNIQETDLLFSLEVLEDILLGNSASPLKKKLLESNLGEQLSDTTGFESETKDTFFSVGLQGVQEADIDKVEDLILETLKEIVENGIDQQLIEASLHQFEISLREIHESSYPTGLALLLRFFGLWMHGGDYKICLDLDQLLSILSQKLKTEKYFESLIQKYLIDNGHRVKMILSPDVEHNKKQEDQLDKMLASTQEKLTEESRKTLQVQTHALNEFQNKKEDLSLLPTLELEDIIINDQPVFHQQSKIDQTQLYSFSVPTNGLTYLSLDFNVAQILKPEDYPLLNLLSVFMTAVGNKLMGYDEFALKMSNKTGGIHVNHGFSLHAVQKNQFLSEMNITGYAINRNFESLTELLSTILFEISFHDFDRARNLLKQINNSLRNSIVQRGHVFAANYALKNFNHYFQLREIISGISYIQHINRLNEKSDKELKELFVQIENLAKKIFSHKPTALVAVSDDDKILGNQEQLQSLISPFTQNNSESSIPIQTIDEEGKLLNDLLITSSAVAYDASVFQTATYGDADCAPLQVLSTLLQSEFLHKEIREKGGAYGGMSTFNNTNGIFSMVSYRDPNIERTFAVYNQAVEWVLAGQFDEQNIKEAILQVFSKIDSPLSPSGESFQEYEFQKIGKTLEMRKNYKKQLLQVNKEQLISVAKKWLTKKSSNAVITGNEKANENSQFFKQNKFNTIQI